MIWENVGFDVMKSRSKASLKRLLDAFVCRNEREIFCRCASIAGGTLSPWAATTSGAGPVPPRAHA